MCCHKSYSFRYIGRVGNTAHWKYFVRSSERLTYLTIMKAQIRAIINPLDTIQIAWGVSGWPSTIVLHDVERLEPLGRHSYRNRNVQLNRAIQERPPWIEPTLLAPVNFKGLRKPRQIPPQDCDMFRFVIAILVN